MARGVTRGDGTATAPAVGATRALLAAVAARLRAAHRAVERCRIREHLRRTERALRRADRPGLTATQRWRRQRQLDRLRAYRRRGAFPTNRAERGRAPCFVGVEGNRCAVAHLLAADGHGALVERVAATDNMLRLESLAGSPVERDLQAWLDRNGLTRAEAARIQPAYPNGVQLATTCGPVPCAVAGAVCALFGAAVFAATEWVGYRLLGEWFPERPLKRRGAFGYATVMNAFLAAFLALSLYVLFP